jgi:hypothetical protein
MYGERKRAHDKERDATTGKVFVYSAGMISLELKVSLLTTFGDIASAFLKARNLDSNHRYGIYDFYEYEADSLEDGIIHSSEFHWIEWQSPDGAELFIDFLEHRWQLKRLSELLQLRQFEELIQYYYTCEPSELSPLYGVGEDVLGWIMY